jgi:phosphatidylglycerophosphatase A
MKDRYKFTGRDSRTRLTDNQAMTEPTVAPISILAVDPGRAPRLARPTAAFMLAHPAHLIALGFGAGLSRIAPGTSGTLWAWLAFMALSPWMDDARWALLIAASLPIGWWACTVTARHMDIADPGSVVWDEIVAFWIVLWLVMPTGVTGQFLAFGLFRFFDAVKPGPVGWADALFHRVDPRTDRHAWSKAGLGILIDDLVAAGCTLLVVTLWRFW